LVVGPGADHQGNHHQSDAGDLGRGGPRLDPSAATATDLLRPT